MKKTLFLLAAGILAACSITTAAQEIKEDIITFNKQRVVAYTITFNESKTVVWEALENKLRNNLQHYEIKREFVESKAVLCLAIDSELIDIYYKIKEDSPINPNTSLSVVVLKGGAFVDPVEDPETAKKIKSYLSNIIVDVNEIAHYSKLEKQQKTIIDAKNKLQQLNDEKEKLLKQQQEIEAKISEIENEISSTKENIDEQKNMYDELKGQKGVANRTNEEK